MKYSNFFARCENGQMGGRAATSSSLGGTSPFSYRQADVGAGASWNASEQNRTDRTTLASTTRGTAHDLAINEIQ